MTKKLTPSEKLLAQAAKATASTSTQKPAGQKAVESTIRKKKNANTTTYNLRLSDIDVDVVDMISDTLRESGLKRPPASDSFRVALRVIAANPKLLKD